MDRRDVLVCLCLMPGSSKAVLPRIAGAQWLRSARCKACSRESVNCCTKRKHWELPYH